VTVVRPHLLVVDDDPVLVDALRELLIRRFPDAEVETCTSPTTSLERIASVDYDAILSDVRMPGVDGITLLKRAHALRPDTPILLLTGMGEYDLAVQALRGGAFDFIAKPVDIDYLATAVARALRVREIVEARTAELRAANKVKDEFLATLSHELRTPLTAILGWSKLLLRGDLDPRATRSAIEAIERNATHQTRLVDDLLDVSRIMTGKLTIAKTTVDVGAVASATLEGMAPMLRAHAITVERAIGDRTVIRGDSVRLQQIVSNLISNAIKFSTDGSRVGLRVSRDNGTVTLAVTDTGIGIPQEFLPFLFQPFHQADGTLARSRNGLGIGLAIVKHLVDLHGGKITAKSDGPNRGSTFTVTFPAIDERSNRADVATRMVSPDLDGFRVLLVEDDPDARALMRFTLERSGANVTDVDSAAQAFDALAQGAPFDALLCDVSMPHEDGYSFIKRVRARGTKVRAAAVTAHARPEDVERAMAAGFDLHLSKPVDPRDLVATVVELGARPSSTA
jgi:signal transduction histidine kinase